MRTGRLLAFRIGFGTALGIVCASVLPLAASANLIANPSFEIGSGSLPDSCGAGCSYSLSSTGPSPDATTIPDWTISTFTGGAGVFVPGGTPLVPVPDGSAVAFTSGGALYQTVAPTVVVGDTYTLTAWIADYTGGGYNQFVQSAYVDFGATSVFGGTATGLISGAWTQVSGTFTAAADAGDPITVVLFNQGGAGQAQFDDISLTVSGGSSDPGGVPEPAAVLVLGVGLAALSFVRRRISA